MEMERNTQGSGRETSRLRGILVYFLDLMKYVLFYDSHSVDSCSHLKGSAHFSKAPKKAWCPLNSSDFRVKSKLSDSPQRWIWLDSRIPCYFLVLKKLPFSA